MEEKKAGLRNSWNIMIHRASKCSVFSLTKGTQNIWMFDAPFTLGREQVLLVFVPTKILKIWMNPKIYVRTTSWTKMCSALVSWMWPIVFDFGSLLLIYLMVLHQVRVSYCCICILIHPPSTTSIRSLFSLQAVPFFWKQKFLNITVG